MFLSWCSSLPEHLYMRLTILTSVNDSSFLYTRPIVLSFPGCSALIVCDLPSLENACKNSSQWDQPPLRMSGYTNLLCIKLWSFICTYVRQFYDILGCSKEPSHRDSAFKIHTHCVLENEKYDFNYALLLLAEGLYGGRVWFSLIIIKLAHYTFSLKWLLIH